jgi:hypothetical protein
MPVLGSSRLGLLLFRLGLGLLGLGRRLGLLLLATLGLLASASPLPPPPSPMRAIVSPTGSVSPSWATIESVPSWSASSVMLALSVSISTSSSPRLTSSPSDFSH